jgi:hypothetical protein
MQHYELGLTRMKTLTAKDAKYGFGNLIDLASRAGGSNQAWEASGRRPFN